MKLARSFAIIISVSSILSASCSNATTPPASSSAGALTANSAPTSPVRPFGRHTLNAAGSNYLNEFLRDEVRAKLDEEPVGDTDAGYDPGTMSTEGGVEQTEADAAPENQPEDAEPRVENEESYTPTSRLDTQKYSWATKSFGDAVKAAPTNKGVIVLYADDAYYDTERLTAFVEEGRNRIVQSSGIGSERVQVVFGGYRSIPQVELWVIQEGGTMPEFKPEEKPKAEN